MPRQKLARNCRYPALSRRFVPFARRDNSTAKLLVILVIVIIIFGANRLPQLGAGVGSAIKNFKNAMGSADERGLRPTTIIEQTYAIFEMAMADDITVMSVDAQTPGFARLSAGIPASARETENGALAALLQRCSDSRRKPSAPSSFP